MPDVLNGGIHIAPLEFKVSFYVPTAARPSSGASGGLPTRSLFGEVSYLSRYRGGRLFVGWIKRKMMEEELYRGSTWRAEYSRKLYLQLYVSGSGHTRRRDCSKIVTPIEEARGDGPMRKTSQLGAQLLDVGRG